MSKQMLIKLPENQILFEDYEQEKGYYSASTEVADNIQKTNQEYFNQQMPDNLTVKVLRVGVISEDYRSITYGIVSYSLIDIAINKITGSIVKM